jgi:plastocyanin
MVEEQMRLRPSWFFAAAGLALAACSGGGNQYTAPDGGTDGGEPGPYPTSQNLTGPHVAIQDFTFTPQTITIKAGQSVTWTNTGSSVLDVTSDTMVFESGNMMVGGGGNASDSSSSQGGVFSFTFTTPGTYTYYSMLHPPSDPASANFTGTVIVTP